MNLETIRKVVSRELNVYHIFHYRGGRGCNDKFGGKIIKIYPRIFLIETNSGKMKCFSYSDFLIKTLKII